LPAGDSVYVTLGDETVGVTGFAPGRWGWANSSLPNGAAAQLAVRTPGLYTLTLQMREDGLRLDRLLLTTDTAYVPADSGPVETERITETTALDVTIDHVINYDYDNLYRLTGAGYSTGESYAYDYDPVGNRLAQIIDGDTTAYLYDAANRLQSVNGETYTFDANGNLLNTGVMTNVFDTANRLVETAGSGQSLAVSYDGLGNRVGQTVGLSTTHFALDVAGGLPEIIYTSDGNRYLHLPGVIVAESAVGEVRYLLSDGLGSVRQAVDDRGAVTAYNEFDPYGKPIVNRQSEIVNPYGFTGEWWQSEVGLTTILWDADRTDRADKTLKIRSIRPIRVPFRPAPSMRPIWTTNRRKQRKARKFCLCGEA
jgi:YD repeat-containing protein